MLAPEVLADVAGELLPEPAGGDALEGADEPGQGDLRRVADEEVDVAGFAVELAEFRAEVRAGRLSASFIVVKRPYENGGSSFRRSVPPDNGLMFVYFTYPPIHPPLAILS